MFEHLELFRRPLGLGSDVVAKEMYEFTDKGGRQLVLRPEGTAPVVRAFVRHGLYAKGARQKLFYIGPIFRYDRPQAGRFRQHHQIGVEVFGNPAASQDAEIMELGNHLLVSLGVTDYDIRINTGGCPACRPSYEARLKTYAQAKGHQLCKDCSGYRMEHNVMRILDCKNESCRAQTQDAPDIIDGLCEGCAQHYQALLGHLDALGLRYVRDFRLMRGFDYYSRTAFEFVLREDVGDPPARKVARQGTLLGGGRYDGLVELLGGPSTPAVGWGMGLERVLSASPEPAAGTLSWTYVVATTEGAYGRAQRLCRNLRHGAIACEMGVEGKSLNSQMRAANASGASYAVLVDPDSANIGLKDLKTGIQEELTETELLARLQGGLR